MYLLLANKHIISSWISAQVSFSQDGHPRRHDHHKYEAVRDLLHFYRPQRSCDKVMFLHVSVILSTGVSGRHHPRQTPLGRHPWGTCTHPSPRQLTHGHTTRTDTLHPVTATVADGTHPTGMHSCWKIKCA